MGDEIRYRETRDLPPEQVLRLYLENGWSAAGRPRRLCTALVGSHALVSAWDGRELVGLGNAISDGALVVYYPHLLVRPSYRRRGIGRALLAALQERYRGFHQQVLIADAAALGFYERCGFRRAGSTQAMWIYAGDEH